MTLIEQIEPLKQSALAELRAAADVAALEQAKGQYLGAQGKFTALMKQLGTLPKEEKPAAGKLINQAKVELEAALAERRTELEMKASQPKEPTDFTLPGRRRAFGRLHPLTQVTEDIVKAFRKLGFAVADGPEIEDEYHNFDALNTPADHPARDMQDTLYLAKSGDAPSPPPSPGYGATSLPSPPVGAREGNAESGVAPSPSLGERVGVRGNAIGAGAAPSSRPSPPMGEKEKVPVLLRTHTSPVQIRVMEKQKPPVRVIALGRVFRRDNADATHNPTFHQVEGLYVDKNVTVGDLKGTVEFVVKEIFGSDVKVRFRPSFFPFTEPSYEIDFTCPLVKKMGKEWLELAGCGMVHPQVFENVGYDPEVWTGWAFGFGIERIAMLRYEINDIRLFYENDLRFLRQF